MLDNVDWQSMDSDEYPGADLPPHYEPPIFPSAAALGDIAEGEKMYHGNCHCKIVRYTVKTQNLDQQDVMRCNCSLCSRVGGACLERRNCKLTRCRMVTTSSTRQRLLSYLRGRRTLLAMPLSTRSHCDLFARSVVRRCACRSCTKDKT